MLLETPEIRVLEIVIEPGAREPEHVHRSPSVVMVDGPARIRHYDSEALAFTSTPTVDRAAARATWPAR